MISIHPGLGSFASQHFPPSIHWTWALNGMVQALWSWYMGAWFFPMAWIGVKFRKQNKKNITIWLCFQIKGVCVHNTYKSTPTTIVSGHNKSFWFLFGGNLFTDIRNTALAIKHKYLLCKFVFSCSGPMKLSSWHVLRSQGHFLSYDNVLRSQRFWRTFPFQERITEVFPFQHARFTKAFRSNFLFWK